MTNRLVALLLICSLCAEQVSRLLVTAAFELNQSYIAEYLCVNRDKPLLHCDGKCFLAKKLKEAEEKEKKSEKESQKSSYQPAFISEKAIFAMTPDVERTIHHKERPFALPSRTFDIFHPPRA
jgi:hypothetical protein